METTKFIVIEENFNHLTKDCKNRFPFYYVIYG